MASLKDIRDRIKSVKSIQKVTSAMKMVAAAKVRKAQEKMEQARPYTHALEDVIHHILPDVDRNMLDLLEVRDIKRKAYVIVSADRGLAGAFNTNITKIAQNEIDHFGKELEKDDKKFLSHAEKIIFKQIKKSLKSLGIQFNTFANEKSFYESGAIKKLLSDLEEKKLIYEEENATWYKATAVGASQDKVYIKSSGEPTYRLPDTAYHRDKVDRKFDLIVDIFGADHTDTYPDVLSALSALDINTEHIKILIYQFVTLIKNGEKVKMSTRKADFITLDHLIDELGLDIVRYFFIMRSMNTHLDFDLNLAKDQSDKNPVFYLQYAFARICNIIRYGENQGFEFSEKFDSSLLNEVSEIKLLKLMANFPVMMKTTLKTLEPQIVANYLQDLASSFHKFYGNCKVITEDKKLSHARLGLIHGSKIILSTGLTLLGICAPEKM